LVAIGVNLLLGKLGGNGTPYITLRGGMQYVLRGRGTNPGSMTLVRLRRAPAKASTTHTV
jgi:hypothetical protein